MNKTGIRVGVLGASGYGGAGLLRRLSRHPNATVTALASRQYQGQPVDACWPQLAGLFDLRFGTVESVLEACEVVFCATPHGATAPLVKQAREAGLRVLDLSADYRLPIDLYEQWYVPHPHPELYQEARYGLVELHRDELANAKLIAVPGCNSSTVNLVLAPFAQAGLVTQSVIADLKVGVSGAGRGQNAQLQYAELNENVKPYKLARTHRHTAEVELTLRRIKKQGRQLMTHGDALPEAAKVSFNPHLIPMTRGILATCYIPSETAWTDAALIGLLNDFYQADPMVYVQTELPQTKAVTGSDRCIVSARYDDSGYIVALAATDNLGRGAAGQAVQNFNLMHGLAETSGLYKEGIWP